jgi:hypothetical protein
MPARGRIAGRLDFSRTALVSRRGLPMNRAGEMPAMQVTVTVSETVVREAGARGLAIVEFIESLIDKGMQQTLDSKERPVLSSAIERIRALHSSVADPGR